MAAINHTLDDQGFMRMALHLASVTEGQTGINPQVGCVVVKDGRIIGLGAHLKRGEAHAEIHALNMAGGAAEGSTLYVTLEPCTVYGKTPPCADRIIRDKVKRVVIATTDPNPMVAGSGEQKLREHGIEVVSGVLETEAQALNEKYNTFMVKKRPFVTLKCASTMDGKLAASSGDSRWITNDDSRLYVHQLRHRHDAIMVGIQTVLQDNPSLTTRLPVPGLHPVKVIVDSRLRLPLDAKVVTDPSASTIVLTTEAAGDERKNQLMDAGVDIIVCGAGPQVDLGLGMEQLAQRELASVLLEGGGKLNGSMLEAALIDKVVMFYAAKLIGGKGAANFEWAGRAMMQEAVRLSGIEVQSFGDDWCVTGYPVYA